VPPPFPDPQPDHSPATVRRRALSGAALVVGRGFVIRLLGFLSYIVVARFVSPEEFGVFTLGASIVTAGWFLADAGMGAALVRRTEEPDRADLRAVQGVQLAVSGSFTAVGLAIGFLLGGDALVVSVMLLALPIVTLRVPALTMLERHLTYKPLVAVEVAETLAYTLFTVVAVVAGAGVWGLALAVVVRAVVGTVAMTRVGPVGFVLPSVDRARVRPVLRFGATYQALGAVGIANEQIFNPGVTAIAGVGALGIWGLAYRLLQLPQLIFQSLRRVSYPAMSRLVGAGEDLKETVERTARLAAVSSGFVLVPLAACAPALVPLVFGRAWTDAADIVPGLCLGLMIGGPTSVAVAAFLLAADRAGVALRSAIVRVCVMLTVSFTLLPVLGVVALGLGYATSAIVEARMLSGAARQELGVRLGQVLAPSCLAATGAAAAGWAAGVAIGESLAGLAVSGAVSLGLFGITMWMLSRPVLIDAIQLARRVLPAHMPLSNRPPSS